MANIAVLIPHYNYIEGLERSLGSISDIEPVHVVIVDDGSTRKPGLADLRKQFPKIEDIQMITFENNRGIEFVLNAGLRYIRESGRYKYVARLDCGDICHPDRFKIQREFLEKNEDTYMVGSWVSFVDMAGEELFVKKYPLRHEDIKRRMFINNMFSHPAIMFRTEIIEKVEYYPVEFKYAEDYAYFFRIMKHFRTANIDKVLLRFEINPKGISLTRRRTQLMSRIRIILDNWEWAYSVTAAYGIARSCAFLLLPGKATEKLKKQIFQRWE